MKKAIFMTVIALFLAAKAYAYDNGDLQIWNTDVEEFKVNKGLKIAFEEEFRWGKNVSEFYYQHYDVGGFYSPLEWVNVGGGYRQIYELVKGGFKPENEPYLTATLFWDLGGFKFEDRSRVEYRNFDYKSDSWRYRNKAALKFPWKFTKIGIQPYLADEIFMVFGGVPGDLNQNRFSAGFSMNLTKELKAEIYYTLQSAKSPREWVETNVLGAKLKIAF